MAPMGRGCGWARGGGDDRCTTPRAEADGIFKRAGGLQTLRNVSFNTPLGHVLAVIGSDGAGKGTLVNCVSGATVPDTGNDTGIRRNQKPPRLRFIPSAIKATRPLPGPARLLFSKL